VNGAAMGGGVGLATLCDFTLAGQRPSFWISEVRIGFVPAIGLGISLAPSGREMCTRSAAYRKIIRSGGGASAGLGYEIVPADRLWNEQTNWRGKF